MTFKHLVRGTDAGSELQVEVALSGPLSFIWAKILGKQFATSVPEDLQRLIAIVER